MALRYATFRNILTAHARKGYFWSSGQKSDPAFRFGDLDFLIGQYVFYPHTFSQWFGDYFSAHAQK